MVFKLGEGNPINPFISFGSTIFEEVVSTSCFSSAPASTVRPHLEGDNDCFDTLESVCEKIVSFVSLVFQVISDFFIDFARLFCGERSIPSGALEATAYLSINRARIAEAPEPLNLQELNAELSFLDPNIKVDELKNLYKSIFDKTEQNQTDCTNIKEFINFVKGMSGPSQVYNESLVLITKLIIVELRKADIPVEKKKAALLGIAESQKCKPRRFEEAQRQLKYLTNRVTTLDQLVLGWLQVLKENILIERFPSSQFHILNYMRREVGKEWGLDCSEVNMQDQYIEMGHGLTGSFNYRYALYSGYTPASIVNFVREKFLEEGDNSQFNEYIQRNLSDGEDIGSFFEQDGSTISYRGVAWLLQKLDFLY